MFRPVKETHRKPIGLSLQHFESLGILSIAPLNVLMKHEMT
jgi:hypothetical protein